jgi:hypothetical protein
MDIFEQISWNISEALRAVDEALAVEWWTVNRTRLGNVRQTLHETLRTLRRVQGEIDTSPDAVHADGS